MKRALARWRWAGVGVIWDADDTPAEAPAITAASQPSTVSVTVVYVQAGAHLTIGGVSIDAPAIQAIPQRDAINASTTEETDGAH